MKPLSGKVAIVTGAGRGIGRAIAITLSRAGARVTLASRSELELRSVAEEIANDGGEALVVPTDLTRDEEMERLVQQTLREWGTIDLLVNNAGWGKKGPVVSGKIEDWDRTFQVNLRAPMALSRLVLPTMMEQKSGAIINIGSISGKTGQADSAAYCASKFGVVGFTEALFEEVREYGIRVSAIHPGFVDTPLIPPNRKLDRSRMIRPEDIAQTVMYLLACSPAACPVEVTVRPQKTPYK